MAGPSGGRRSLVVVGNGMVGHELVTAVRARDGDGRWGITVVAEENRLAYDRVGLSSYFTGTSPEQLSLVGPGAYDGVTVHLGDPVATIDRGARQVTSAAGRTVAYDALVLATGSAPFVPPVPGRDLPGCFVYRTIDDLEAISAHAAGARVGAVVGGGLLGLEAANALLALGLETHVVESAPRLMSLQVDEGGAAALASRIAELGVSVHTGALADELLPARGGKVGAIRLKGGDELAVDLVVFAAGVRPRDELARAAGLDVGPRGGVVVDEACRTSDPAIFAVGECAQAAGRTWGLVAPGYEMARVVAARLLGEKAAFTGADLSARLKLLGVDVASFGDAFGETPGSEAVTFIDPAARVYKRLTVDAAGRRVLGGILVGEASGFHRLRLMALGEMPTPENPGQLLFAPPAGGDAAGAPAGGAGVGAMAETATVCSCNNVTKGAICAAIDAAGTAGTAGTAGLADVKAATRAGTTCGGCVPLVTDLLRARLREAGMEVRTDLCEHFPHTRQELFDLVRVRRIGSFAELLAGWGRGRGCEICKPAVASMLASVTNGYILSDDQAGLQDTNDHFLANLQRDGTYSVVPRLPGGEVTPDQLIAIGKVAQEFGLYTKITGGQRIDLFGAHVDHLPTIWARLIEAGLESGHAYGKALRTVKSCVGQSWCRYGVQDSTGLAVALELRYRGLRAPHKIKSAVSGCARECAEAQSKDFGVIATERGWNLYVCGNGGMRPQHAVLLAADLSTETLVRSVDRFLMYYIRTADRLERTATWLNRLEGGIEHLRRVVMDDALGIGAELEGDMARHVATYQCEWKATLSDPVRVGRFRTFLNDTGLDPGVAMVPERSQHRPAQRHEKPAPGPAAIHAVRAAPAPAPVAVGR